MWYKTSFASPYSEQLLRDFEEGCPTPSGALGRLPGGGDGGGWRKGSWIVRKALKICLLLILCLQSLLTQYQDFGTAFEPLKRKLWDLQARTQAENVLQRDLPGKQAQLSRVQVRGPWGPRRLCSGAQLSLVSSNRQLPQPETQTSTWDLIFSLA